MPNPLSLLSGALDGRGHKTPSFGGLLAGAFMLLAVLSACSGSPPPLPPATAEPTAPLPSPTPTAQAVSDTPTSALPEATPTAAATSTATFTPTPYPITLEPAFTPTPEPPLPEADILITAPGPLSKVTSPILLRALVAPGAGGRVRIELFGEDGRMLVRQILVFNAQPNRKVSLSAEVEYEIAAVAETGRLSVSVDDRYGRLQSLASVDLILLSSGEADINPPGDRLPSIIIQEPPTNALIQGGEVLVAGLARLSGDQTLILELVRNDGKIIGSRLAAVAEAPQGQHRQFAAAIPYQLEETTRVLLVVRERGVRIPGTAQLSSREIVLTP